MAENLEARLLVRLVIHFLNNQDLPNLNPFMRESLRQSIQTLRNVYNIVAEDLQPAVDILENARMLLIVVSRMLPAARDS